MSTSEPLLGLCPIGKFVFSHEAAKTVKTDLQERLRRWQVPFVDLEGVLEDGLVRDQAHVAPAVRHFRNAQVDCLFVPHCNFGTEGAVGMIARQLGLPTLLWGPRDAAPNPDGTRDRDSLCGLLASSKVLRKLGVSFTYIENCGMDEPVFRGGLDRFRRAAHAANALRRGIRIGLLGQRIDFFWTTIVNESELLERFHVEVLPLDMPAFIAAVQDRAERGHEGYAEEAARWRREADIEGFDGDAPLHRIFAVRDQLQVLVDEHGLDGLAIQDFDSLVEAMGAYCFFANSFLAETVGVGCEADIHGAISTVLLQRAALGDSAAWLADITVRHPHDDNGVLLWHAGAPLSMKAPAARVRLGRHWILPSPVAGMPHFPLRQGPITVCRFDGDTGDYQLAVGEGDSMEGPDTLNNYVWMKVDDWPRWERLLMEGPFIHHSAMGYGLYGQALLEACRHVPGLSAVPLNREMSP